MHPDSYPPAEFLSIDEVARMLDCSVRSVRRLCDTGQIPQPLMIGQLVRWRRVSLEYWLRETMTTQLKESNGGTHDLR